MNLSAHPDRLQLLAAAHALGTLRGGARRRFEAIAREQPSVREAALAWQHRLAGMTELQAPVQPDDAVWLRIRNLIEADREQAAMAAQRRPAAAKPTPATPTTVSPAAAGWWRNLAFWRGTAAAGALATVVAVGIGLDLAHRLRVAPEVQYVAVLSDDRSDASMLVTFDPKNNQLVMQRLNNWREGEDKSLQLWALPPGGAPRSLGVLGKEPALKIRAREADVQAVPALAISLEPRGGVPPGQGPSGPVLFKGKLIEKTL